MTEPSWSRVQYPPIDYQDAYYYAEPRQKKTIASLDELDPEIRRTYEKLGIPEAERQRLVGGVAVVVLAGEHQREQVVAGRAEVVEVDRAGRDVDEDHADAARRRDPALDARSLKLSLQGAGGSAVAPDTVRAVEDAILTRARQLRVRDGQL